MSFSPLRLLPKHGSIKVQLLKHLVACKKVHYSTLLRSNTQQEAVEKPSDQDELIRMLFDDKSIWKINTKTRSISPPVGLFENPHFGNVHGINYAAQQAIQRAQIIVERICNAPENGVEEMRKVVKNLDRLSDTLCTVIDMAEFVRNAHPDGIIMEAANKAYGDLCSYMNTLNTDSRMHEVSLVYNRGVVVI